MTINKKHDRAHVFSVVLILVSNICFYTEETITLYLFLTALGMVIELESVLIKVNFNRVRLLPCIIWLLLIYAIFTYNGLFRLMSGEYNWDFMIYTLAQNMSLYFAFNNILISKCWYLQIKPIVYVSTWISICVIVINEIGNIIAGSMRIGDSLSGNVVTVGAYFGILSVFLAYICSLERKIFSWLTYIITVALMLVTGSKVTIIILIIDLLLFINSARQREKAILIAFIGGLVVLFVIFCVPYFYQIIGFRIEDMLFQMFGIGHGRLSNSTQSREIMIKEGLQFMWEHPVFGGGEKYFGSRTSTTYGYSHCNYIELLVNFGLLGFLIYYVPVFKNFIYMMKTRKRVNEYAKLCIALMATRLIVDWTMMTHSETCIGYLPMIISFVYVDINRKRLQTEERHV